MGKVVSKEVVNYHDFRWCKPCFDDIEAFAMLSLEIMQTGLSWGTILKKEIAIREAFDFFNVETVATYGSKKIKNLLNNPKIVRNSRKIKAIIDNAKAFLEVKNDFEFFYKYIWGFVNYRVIDHRLGEFDKMPVKNELSEKISFDLKKRGFKFVGPIVIYSYLQAMGVFNDHCVDCEFR